MEQIESQLKEKGYVKAYGAALLNDVAVTKTIQNVLSPVLSTQESVDLFNMDVFPGWQLYRKAR